MKVIFFDIDGTLINEWGQMPKTTVQAIKKVRENGHLCIVNTGRTASLVLDWLPALAPFDGYLCGCGTHVFFRGKELLHRTFPPEQALEVMKGLEEHGIDAILEGAGNDYHNDLDKMHTETFRNYILRHYAGRGWGSYREAPGNFDKFYCFADQPGEVRKFVEERADVLDLIDRGAGYFEVVPKGFSKGTCMDFLVEYLNASGEWPEKITLKDTVAIGDSSNDLPMMEHAHVAIAMGNSSKAVLDVADFVTAEVMDDGIWKALEWLGCLEGNA